MQPWVEQHRTPLFSSGSSRSSHSRDGTHCEEKKKCDIWSIAYRRRKNSHLFPAPIRTAAPEIPAHLTAAPVYRSQGTHRKGSLNPAWPDVSCQLPGGASRGFARSASIQPRGSRSIIRYIASKVVLAGPEVLLSLPLAVESNSIPGFPALRNAPRRALPPRLSPASLPSPPPKKTQRLGAVELQTLSPIPDPPLTVLPVASLPSRSPPLNYTWSVR